MSTKVYANGREISGKASGNKSVAAMPDVCLSPPGPPAGPIPIPYPNTAQSSDTGDGSKSVMVNGKEVGLKNKSIYKASKGDEAATRNFGGGIVSHTITGKTKFAAWSFDVKVEGQNVVRHMDLTTHNHQNPSNGALTVSVGSMLLVTGSTSEKDCAALAEDNEELVKSIQAGEESKKGGPTSRALQEKTTLTTAQYKHPNGKQYNMKGFSREVKSDSYAKGVGTNYVKDAETGLGKHLAQPSSIPGWKYSDGGRPHASHTECRILEDIFKSMFKPDSEWQGKPKGKLLMNIRWHKGDGDTSFRPCARCQRIICQAKENKMEIEFCDKKHQRWTIDCSKKKPQLVRSDA